MLTVMTAWIAFCSQPGAATRASRSAAQSLVEYGLLVALIAVAALVATQTLGGGISAMFTRILGHFAGVG
jgi:Flp pilus assembly pilin Flp